MIKMLDLLLFMCVVAMLIIITLMVTRVAPAVTCPDASVSYLAMRPG
jgi:hypothetical protein